MSVPAWIDAEGDEPMNQLEHSNRQRSGTWEDKFPLTVCVRAWQCERSSTSSFIRKKKNTHIRIELKRKPTKESGLHGYRDLEVGSEVGSGGWEDIIERGDTVLFHVLKSTGESSSPTAVISGDSSVTSNSVSTLGFKGSDDFKNAPPDMRDKWKVKVSVPLSNVSLKLDDSKCIATFRGGSSKTYNLYFSSSEEAKSFLDFVRDTKNALREVAASAIRSDAETVSSLSTPLKFLIEIVSATDLKPVDGKTSDPFVVVKFGQKKIHTTSVIKRNLDPVWTVKTGSLFILTLHPEELYNNEVLFDIRDFETFVAGSSLGQCLIAPSELIKLHGDRIEMKLRHLQADEDAQGVLAIRCRKATESDIDFVYRAKSNTLLDRTFVDKFITPHLGKQRDKHSLKRKKVENGVTYHLARPISDDHGAMWMTPAEIETSSKQKSERWIEVGTGEIGHLYVEVIGCDNLANKDEGKFLFGKSDPFATLVYEDSIVTTDVVSDTLNPRFLPWTKRAFRFNMSGVSSPLYIGVFDFDAGRTDHHDPIGRLSIPIQKFVPNTTYMVSYDLYDTHELSNRSSDGSVTLRIRLELNKAQRGLFYNVQSSRNEYSVHLDNKKNYAHAYYTVRGEHDVTRYELKTFMSLLDELLEIQLIKFPIKAALKTLLLWRSHYELKICGKSMWLPIHSMVMYSFAIVIAEFPQYTPSLVLASVAWLMIALLHNERKRPSPWDHPPLYGSLLLRYITNRARPVTIEEFQNSAADDEYMAEMQARHEFYKKEMEKLKEEADAIVKTQEKMESERRKNVLKSKRKRFPKVQLFKALLEPIQLVILPIVQSLRRVKAVAKWDYHYRSFWITTNCLLGSIVLTVLIYFFGDLINSTLFWIKKIVLYGAFSPLNKIVDIKYFSKLDAMTESERDELYQERRSRQRILYEGAFLEEQLKLENYLKEEAFKTVMYGPNIVVVPSINTPERFMSIPKPSSYAVPSQYKPHEELTSSNLGYSLKGQTMEKENIIPADYSSHVKYPLLPKTRAIPFDESHPDSKTPLVFHSSKEMVGGTFP